jgi:AraC-like DNA-binding protein
VPSSTVYVASDVDQFAGLVRPQTEHTITGRGVFAATATRIDLHRLKMQRIQVRHSGHGQGHQLVDRAAILFAASGMVWKGVELAATDIGLVHSDQPFWYNNRVPIQFGSMSLPPEELAGLSVAMADRDLTLPRNHLTMRTTPASHAKLLRLHAATSNLAEHAPEILAHPEAARGLEQALIEAMFACMDGQGVETKPGWRRQTAIVKRFRAALEENTEEPIYMPELCQKLGLSMRALRNYCHDHLGMAPKRYLLLRRMNLAYQALRAAQPSKTTVTQVATRFGFWELGRFAVEYRAWCGELPSATLNRAPN